MSSHEFATYVSEDRSGYDPNTETYHRQHQWDGEEPLANTIVRTVTAVTGDDPTELEPLYEVVDPYVLEEFLQSIQDAGEEQWGTVEFEFNGRTVTIGSHGEVCVQCEPDERPSE